MNSISSNYSGQSRQSQLLQLALQASQAGDPSAAILHLQEAVSLPDATGAAHFMLGAEYAQARRYEEAIREMETAITLDPNLFTARFQLGLLYLTSGNAAAAEHIFKPLENLGSDTPLACFAKGLSCLIHDQFPETVDWLQRGIALNRDNPALSGDMQKVIDQVQLVLNQPQQQEQEGNVPLEDNEAHQHVLLSVYTDNEKT